MEIPEKTRKEYQATFGSLCAVVNAYNEKNLIYRKVQLNSTGMTPGICTWNISHHELGVLGLIKVIELAPGDGVIEVYPRWIVTREEVLRSIYGPEVNYVEAQAYSVGAESAMEQSELYYDEVRDKMHENILKEYTDFVGTLIPGIEAHLVRIETSENFQPSKKDLIDQACLEWAGRGYMSDFNMEEFLSDFENNNNLFIGKFEFKRALQDAGRRGIIQKVKGRWRNKTSP